MTDDSDFQFNFISFQSCFQTDLNVDSRRQQIQVVDLAGR